MCKTLSTYSAVDILDILKGILIHQEATFLNVFSLYLLNRKLNQERELVMLSASKEHLFVSSMSSEPPHSEPQLSHSKLMTAFALSYVCIIY